MKDQGANAKEKIFHAVFELLSSGENAQRLTSRQIAAKADVNLALVNYYYRSKENLLSEVVGKMMAEIIGPIMSNENDGAASRLKDILTATADAAFAHENICKIAISSELKNGCKSSCEMVLPLLKEILPSHSQQELDITALQLMQPFHHIMLEPALYSALLGTDFYNKQKREQKIAQMISCAIAK